MSIRADTRRARLRVALAARGLEGREIARRCAVDPGLVSHWTAGRRHGRLDARAVASALEPGETPAVMAALAAALEPGGPWGPLVGLPAE